MVALRMADKAKSISGDGRTGLRHFPQWFGHSHRRIDSIPQFFAGFKVRGVFSGNSDLLARFGITSCPGSPIIQRETAKAADFDALAGLQRLADRLNKLSDRHLGVLSGQLRETGRQCFDKFGTGHTWDCKGDKYTLSAVLPGESELSAISPFQVFIDIQHATQTRTTALDSNPER